MATFPTGTISLVNPTANDTLAGVPHHTQHGDANDEIEAIEGHLRGGWGGSFDARAFGQVGDGTTDDTAAIVAAIAAAVAAGGGDVHVHGLAKITSTITWPANVGLWTGREAVGSGSHQRGYQNIAAYDGTVGLLWAGAAGGTMLQALPSGAAGISGIRGSLSLLAGKAPFTSVAGIGVQFSGVNNSVIETINGLEFSTALVYLTSIDVDARFYTRDVNSLVIKHIYGRQWVNAGNILRTRGTNSTPTQLDPYGFSIGTVKGYYRDGEALDFGFTDHANIRHVDITRWSGDGTEAAGTAVGVRFRSASYAGGHARYIDIGYIRPGAGGVHAEGTEVDTVASGPNIIHQYHADYDGPAAPTVGTATRLYWWDESIPRRQVVGTLPDAKRVAYEPIFYTPYGQDFYWTGSTWLTPGLYAFGIPPATAMPLSGSAVACRAVMPLSTQRGIRIERFSVTFYVAAGASALGASHSWLLNLETRPLGDTSLTSSGTAIGALTIDSGASGEWRAANFTMANFQVFDAATILEVHAYRTGTPGDLTMVAEMHYRVVAA